MGRWAPYLAVGGAFAVSRVAYFAAGVRLRPTVLRLNWQLVDPELLDHRLFESIWYLHTQPPLWNLLVGLVLRWSPVGTTNGLRIVYAMCGLVLMLGLYDLGRQLRLGRWTAVIVAIVIGCAPGAILYESFLNYEYLVATLLVLLAAAIARWVRNGHVGALAAVAALAATATLTRGLLHPVWFVAVIAFALLVRRPERWSWRPIAAIAVPFVLVGGAMVKNQMLFGSPQLSSLGNFALYEAVLTPMSAQQVARLRAENKIALAPFPGKCQIDHPDVPAVARNFKSTLTPDARPELNWNWECLPPHFEKLRNQALAVAWDAPVLQAERIVGELELWATPSQFYSAVVGNRQRIAGIDELYRRVLLLDVAWDPPVSPRSAQIALSAPDYRYHLSLTIVFSTLLVGAVGVLILVQSRRRPLGPARAAYVFGAATTIFVTLAGAVLAHGEINRIRVIVEPLTFVLAVAAVAAATRAIRDRSEATNGTSPQVATSSWTAITGIGRTRFTR